MRTMILIGSLCLAAALAFGEGECPGKGTITGRVVDRAGKAVGGAVIDVVPEGGCVSTGIAPTAKSQTDGSFELRDVPFGPQRVHASKVEDGYPNTGLALYANAADQNPRVVVHVGEVVRNVVVTLSERVGRISGQVVDEKTLKSVGNARVEIRSPDDDSLLMETGAGAGGTFYLLLPNRPVKLAVRADGYELWRYEKTIKLNATDDKEITVRLKAAAVSESSRWSSSPGLRPGLCTVSGSGWKLGRWPGRAPVVVVDVSSPTLSLREEGGAPSG